MIREVLLKKALPLIKNLVNKYWIDLKCFHHSLQLRTFVLFMSAHKAVFHLCTLQNLNLRKELMLIEK